MKRILSLLIAMIMALGCVGITAMAEETAATEVATEEELSAALTAGGTVKLGADITITSAITTSGVVATIDLNGKTLNIRAGDNRFEDVTNLTFENGTINIDGVVASANAIFRIDEYEKNLITTVTLNNVNVTGSNYSSAFGVFYIGASSVLNVNGGTWTLSNDKFSAGGVFKADSESATLNISGATMDLHNVRRVVTYADTTIEDSTLTIYGDADGVDDEMKHGFNYSPLTIDNSTITMSNLNGRGITAVCGDVNITNGSSITITNSQEATIDVRENQTVTVSADSTVSVDEEPIITSGSINGAVSVPADGYVAFIDSNKNGTVDEGETCYTALADAVAAANSGDEIVLLANVEGDITVPANVTFNGNGFAVNGGIIADGDITFAGITKATDFDVKYVGTTINIGKGATLELTGTARMVIGHGCTFNIEGNITDAKTANTAELTPSLIVAAGASFTGTNLTFNVTNAYIKFNNSSTSKNSNANGTFNFNITNSIWEQTKTLVFSAPTGDMDPTVNFNLKDSVLNSTTHLVFAVTKGDIVIDNSYVNKDAAKQLENRSNLTIKNGSVVYATVATSENAKNPGTLTVDNATYIATGEFSGSDLGTGSLILKNGATANVETISKDKATVTLGAGCTLTSTTADLAITTDAGYEVKYENGAYTAVKAPVAYIGEQGYETVQAAINAAKKDETVTICPGEYGAINISNKNITIQGTVGVNGELLTTIKGGDPAIIGHSFNGTIKDIRIVDAWRVMYAEPAGNVTVDNVHVTGATYGFHLVAYSPDLTWKIENSYMDLRWANSFGVSYDGYADIIIRGNEFVSTDPYYSDYGAIHVNSYLPSVTVEENIFRENARIYIDGSVTDTSKIKISKNYHADGVENAFADDADGVTVEIDSYYNTVDENGNLTDLVITPKGNIQVGYFTTNYNNGGRHGIYGEAVNVVGTESFKVELYSGDTLVGTAELVDTKKVLLNGQSKTISWHILLGEDNDTWWNNNWVGGAMNVNALPDKVVLYVDDKKVSEGAVKLHSADDSFPILAVVSDEDGAVHSFIAANGYVNNLKNVAEKLAAGLAAANDGDTVTLVSDVALEKSIGFTKDITFTIDGAGFSIKPAQGSTETNSAFNFGQGSNATVENRNYTIKNIVFDGWTTDHVLRLQGVNATVENCKFINCNQPDGLGLLTLTYCKSTVEDCVFENNTCVKAIDVNSNANADATNATEIKNCTFNNNNCIGAAGVIEAYEGSFTIKDSEFVDNTAVSASIFCATDATISGNYFAENTYTGTKGNEASVLAGPWVEGNYEITINNNAFKDASKPGAYVERFDAYPNAVTTYNLNGNYWNAGEPNYDTTGNPTVTLENYYTEYTDGVLGGLVEIAKPVAAIGETTYDSLENALAAAKDGETVTLIWEEGDAPIAMNGAVFGKSVTITGTADVDWSQGFLFVGRGGEGDGTVTFENANLKSASNSSSTGIHVSGREKNTNNKYDGTVIIKDSTIELDYLINKGTMTLDNSTLTVKNGFSVGGRPASETETGVDATATLNLNNNSKVIVNNHNGMGLGYEALGVMNIESGSTFEYTKNFLITAKGTMNVNGGNVIGNNVTLTNNGTINVSGASDIAANVTGEGWVYMDGVTLDADTKLHGAKVRFAKGTNNVEGSVIDDGFFQVGIGAYNGVDANVDTTNGVIVNVKNAKIGSSGKTYAGWVGTGFYDTDDEKATVMTNAKYVLNIDNSIAEFGYLHISNDGELNVKGNAAEKVWYNNSDYSFYAGDFIINGTATFDATDVLALYTKVSCDNGTEKPGTLNIVNGTEYEAERHNGAVSGTNFELRKTGVVNVEKASELYIGEYTSIAADAVMNIGGAVTALGTITNNGTINLTTVDATITTPEAPTVKSTVAGYEVDYTDGKYSLKKIEEVEKFKLASTNATLGNSLAINFIYAKSDIVGTDYVAKIKHTTATGIEEKEIPYTDWVENGNYIYVPYDGISAKQMGDIVEITICKTDGTVVSETETESLENYAINYFDYYKNDSSMNLWKQAIADMLNYGAAAQTYFGYNADKLVNVTAAADVAEHASTEVKYGGEYKSYGEGAYATSLNLKDKIELIALFTGVTDGMTAKVEFTNHKGENISYEAELRKNGDYHEVIVDKLVIADINQPVKVTVYNEDESEYAWIEDSINEYLGYIQTTEYANPLFEMASKFATSAYAAMHAND